MPLENASVQEFIQEPQCANLFDVANPEEAWHVLWTRSNFEKIVFGQLQQKDYDVFLPMIGQRLNRSKGLPMVKVPMFKGYLFVRHAIDKKAYLDISNTKGLVNILGTRWDCLARVPDHEIQAIRQLADSGKTVSPYPYLKAGIRVKIIRGPMQNAQGILVRSELVKGIFVVSVNLLQRSLSIKVDCSDVVPI